MRWRAMAHRFLGDLVREVGHEEAERSGLKPADAMGLVDRCDSERDEKRHFVTPRHI